MGRLNRLSFLGAAILLIGGCSCGAQTRVGVLGLADPAQSVIEKHPLVRYQQAQTDIDRGLQLQASGAFDTAIGTGVAQSRSVSPLTIAEEEQNALIGVLGSDEITDTTSASLSVSHLYRSGISVAGQWTLTRNVDSIQSPAGVNTSSSTVVVTIPLLRGRGRDAVAAQEAAAETEVKASVYDLTYEISTLLSNAAVDYWDLVANKRLVDIAKEAERRAATDVENTQSLVDADRLPRENLNEVNANLAQGETTRITAEQSLIAAQYNLATDIGMSRQEIASTELIPSDDLPSLEAPVPQPITAEALKAYIGDALKNRSDLIALRTRVDEQRHLVESAKNRLLPALNLTAGAGYNGLQEGRRLKDIFDSAEHNVSSPNASGGVSYSFPPHNDTARGAYLQAVASQRQLELQSTQLEHSIASSVIAAGRAVYNTAQEAVKARSAVELYKKSLAGQREKYHQGAASVVDVLTVESNLTTAMTTLVQSELSYALAVTQFRFATGTIVPPGKSVVSINADVFRTLPAL